MASLSELAGAGCDENAGPSSSARNPVGRVADAILAGRGRHDPVLEQRMLHEDIMAQHHDPTQHNFLHPPHHPPPHGPHPDDLADEFHNSLHPQMGPHGQLLPPHGMHPAHRQHMDALLPPPLVDPLFAAYADAEQFPHPFDHHRPVMPPHMPPQERQGQRPILTLHPPRGPGQLAGQEASQGHSPGYDPQNERQHLDMSAAYGTASHEPQQMPRGDERNWAEQFQGNTPGRPVSDDSFVRALEEAAATGQTGSWAAQFEKDANPEDDLVAAFNAANINPGDDANWQEEFEAEHFEDTYEDDFKDFLGRDSDSTEYQFAEDNPFLNDPAAMERAQQAIREGNVCDAVLALEAVVQAEASNAQAWYLLGTTQAECDDDSRAIAALKRCVETAETSTTSETSLSPEIASALLELGVSYTNELDSSRAINYLRRWLDSHPVYRSIRASVPVSDPTSAESAHGEILQRFLAASRSNPEDAELHIVLGVLHNLSREYEAAVESFQMALWLRPDDHKLWNKLGATFANRSDGNEALRSYRRAVDIRPSFVRAWVNVGTAYANQTSYEHAIRYYLKALKLNGSAGHVWSYLRTTLIALGRDDLLVLVERRDLEAFSQHFDP